MLLIGFVLLVLLAALYLYRRTGPPTYRNVLSPVTDSMNYRLVICLTARPEQIEERLRFAVDMLQLHPSTIYLTVPLYNLDSGEVFHVVTDIPASVKLLRPKPSRTLQSLAAVFELESHEDTLLLVPGGHSTSYDLLVRAVLNNPTLAFGFKGIQLSTSREVVDAGPIDVLDSESGFIARRSLFDSNIHNFAARYNVRENYAAGLYLHCSCKRQMLLSSNLIPEDATIQLLQPGAKDNVSELLAHQCSLVN